MRAVRELTPREAWQLQGGDPRAEIPVAWTAELERAVVRGTPPRLAARVVQQFAPDAQQWLAAEQLAFYTDGTARGSAQADRRCSEPLAVAAPWTDGGTCLRWSGLSCDLSLRNKRKNER